MDTVLNAISPKYFEVNKYGQPDLTVDIIGLTHCDIVIKDVRVELTPIDSLQALTVFIHANPKDTALSEENIQFLERQLFGEELLLKKIKEIHFRFSDAVNSKLPTLEEARARLKQ